jgi:uncharacterized protein (DUF1330 family)
MPKGHILAEVNVTDRVVFDTYRRLAQASIERFGGSIWCEVGRHAR